jgi:hypothetical protein
MCQFQSLYFNDDGYVVYCKKCNRYQLAFGSSLLTLKPGDFTVFCNVVKRKCREEHDFSTAEHSKTVVIPTPCNGMYMLLTKKEARLFHRILEEADTEMKTQQLLGLFNF